MLLGNDRIPTTMLARGGSLSTDMEFLEAIMLDEITSIVRICFNHRRGNLSGFLAIESGISFIRVPKQSVGEFTHCLPSLELLGTF